MLFCLDSTADADEHVILRMRNTRGEIQDIRFELRPSRDSAQGVADELLAAGEDLEAIAENLDRLITQPTHPGVSPSEQRLVWH